jgi:hypothetical protein
VPSSITSLFLLIVLLTPGLTYVGVRELRSSHRRTTPFRETGAVILVSLIADAFVLLPFAAARVVWPQHTPDVGSLIREGTAYAEMHYAELALWSLILLLCASALAAAGGAKFGSQTHPSNMSAWWALFERWDPDAYMHIGCVLDDGSFVEGQLSSFNRSSEDLPDRDLVLAGPLRYRQAGSTEEQTEPIEASAACISARNIKTMFVSYLSPEQEETASVPSEASTPVQAAP